MSIDKSDEYGVDLLPRVKPKANVQKPKMWSVMFVNDDYTPMEFVVLMVVRHFNLDIDDATRFTLKVHQSGRASVGRFTRDVADTKSLKIVHDARKDGHPLVVEPVQAD